MARFSKTRNACLAALVALAAGCRKAPAPVVAVAHPPAAAESAAPQAAASLPPASAESSGYPFRTAEKAAVEDFLRRHADLRLAEDSDRRDVRAEDDVRRLYGVYHPYFVRGDLNDDGILDFVIAFVRRDSARDTPWFSVVVFTGRAGTSGPAFSPGAFLERDVSLSRGDLSVDRDAVLITPDLSDEAVRRYRWDPMRRSYVFVRDDTDEPDTPVPSRT